MVWWLPRLIGTLFALAAGGLIGERMGVWMHTPVLGALLGAAFGVSVVMLVDGLRLARLLRWLRSAADTEAPHGAGFWGELGYSVERVIRVRDRALSNEQRRLGDFLSAIEASPNGVLMLDQRDQIVWCNAVAADQLGLDPLRDRGQAVTNLVRAPAFVAYLQAGEWSEPVSFATRGGELMLAVLVRAYGDGLKLVVSQDVTERLRAEAMRRDFVANVSHEIRSPLTVLAGFVETMATLTLSGAERARVLTLMQQQTDRMRALVSDLLTLAQLEGSPRPQADRWVPMQPLLRRVVADARTLSAGRHQIELNDDGPALELAGAESELVSAAANLVMNAVRYTPDDGRIAIGWRVRSDGQLEIEVRDNGIGIAREHLPRLTERFYRVDPSRARETGGTGLGLAIVKHVMQRHGGVLDIDSTPGKGSSFRLVFPAARVRESQARGALTSTV